MTASRLTLALDGGGLVLPDGGAISAILPQPGTDLSALPRDRVQVVQPFRPFFDHFRQAGFDTVAESGGDCAVAVVFLPRAKAQARAVLADAAARATDLVVVDGAKTDGIDSLLKEVRKRVPVDGPIAKAHGKIFWFRPSPAAFADWRAPDTQLVEGFHTAPGVFSADAIDPASRLLAEALPAHPGRHVADFGAGWGYLAARLLQDDRLETLDLVEADHVALDCARRNVIDSRARFHWADVAGWTPERPLDAVITNPPFHVSRAADPALGRAFIDAAAHVLAPSGVLWLVANRHLPYEAALADRFREVTEIAGDRRFKILRAFRPSRPRR